MVPTVVQGRRVSTRIPTGLENLKGRTQERVDLDDFLDRSTGNVRAGSSSGVDRHDDAALEPECKRSCAVGELETRLGIARIDVCNAL